MGLTGRLKQPMQMNYLYINPEKYHILYSPLFSGYEGLTCEDEINECSSSPCKNGAQCEDLINNYTCHCLPGWTGLHCENRIRPCAANSSLCLNNATCLDLMTTNENIEVINESNDLFVCLCPEGNSFVNKIVYKW